jgi:hypothetical protein
MPFKERIRENVSRLPSLDHLVERAAAGWKLAAMEWERDSLNPPEHSADPPVEPIPFGLRVSDDCTGLAENLTEREIIIVALDMIVEDRPLSQVADELNRLGYQTRNGKRWTPSALFVLLPRMIQVGPRVLTSKDWITRKQRLHRAL